MMIERNERRVFCILKAYCDKSADIGKEWKDDFKRRFPPDSLLVLSDKGLHLFEGEEYLIKCAHFVYVSAINAVESCWKRRFTFEQINRWLQKKKSNGSEWKIFAATIQEMTNSIKDSKILFEQGKFCYAFMRIMPSINIGMQFHELLKTMLTDKLELRFIDDRFLSEYGKKAANARHDQPGGSREKQAKIREIWATGKYSTKTLCAEEEYQALGMANGTAIHALRNAPDPDPWPAKSPK
jgi:hypothetical protein